jgi:azurin
MNHDPRGLFMTLSMMIVRNEDVPAAAHGIRGLPRSSWPGGAAGTTGAALTSWAKSIPPADRTTSDYVETEQLAEDLAGLLPGEQAATLRKELHDLRVAVFLIRTVREQMRYDTPRLVVEAGKPIELRFENADFMPHNLVVIKPGTRTVVGDLAFVMKPEQLDSARRAYVPDSSYILAATKLLNPGGAETLKFTAPVEEGDYEYVCTFPGHFQVMWGTLVVTRDVDAYLQAHPTIAAAAPKEGHEHHHGGEF